MLQGDAINKFDHKNQASLCKELATALRYVTRYPV